jgi:hypothetical protein
MPLILTRSMSSAKALLRISYCIMFILEINTMPVIHPVPLALALTAGAALAQPDTPSPIEREGANINPEHIAHIYYNLVTGEKIATRLSDDFRPADGSNSSEVWMTGGNPCGGFGSTGSALVLDDPFGELGDPAVGNTVLDWGDIAQDSVVDCLQIDWFSFVQDTDTDSDGLGDGVEGFAATWAFYDGDNGLNSCLTRQGLIAFTFFGLAGSYDGTLAGYNLTVDLAGTFSSSIAFEIGDSDSDPQGAAVHNPLQFISDFDSDGNPDGDLDSDGLADFSYSLNFVQPGTIDIDNADADSDTTTGIDGDPLNQGVAAFSIAAPFGTAVDNGDGTWSIDTSTYFGINADGAEDVYDLFDSSGFYIGPHNAGGFNCDTSTPFAQMSMIMYNTTTGLCCPVDLNCDAVIDIFDVFVFLEDFNSGSLNADWTGDGTLDIFDVFAFLDAFNAGCP